MAVVRCLPSMGNLLSVIPVCSGHITRFCQSPDIQRYAKPVGKLMGLSDLIALCLRDHCWSEQLCPALKRSENQIGAIWYFVHHYNELLRSHYLSLLVQDYPDSFGVRKE